MKHILIVDDSATVRRHVAQALSCAGYPVEAVSGGKEAILSYKQNPAVAVILDVVMPDMDGLETLQALRSIDDQVRVLGITGVDPRFSALYLKLLRTLGAKAVLTKPFSDSLLVETIGRMIAASPRTPDDSPSI